jgi:hypothetical protein
LQIVVICILGVQMKMAALVWGISSITFSIFPILTCIIPFLVCIKWKLLSYINIYLSSEVPIWFALQKFWKAQYLSFLWLRFVLLVTYFNLFCVLHNLKIILVLMHHLKHFMYSLCWMSSPWSFAFCRCLVVGSTLL